MALYADDLTEVWDFENNGDGTKASKNLTEVNTPTYGTTSPPQGTYYADLDAATDEHYTLADDNDLDTDDGDYSVSFWFYVNTGYPAGSLNIATKGGLFAADGWSITDYYTGGSTYELSVKHRDASSNFFNFSGFDVYANTDAWFHAVASFNSSSLAFTWWVSSLGGTFGDQVNGATGTWLNSNTGNSAANTGAFFLGSVDATNTYDGRLDEFAFFKGKQINATEAESIYDGTWRSGGSSIAPQAMNHLARMQSG